MTNTSSKGALRSLGAGRERMGYNTNASILGRDWRRIKTDPDRFAAARLVRVGQHAGHAEVAADVAQAYGLRRPIASSVCRCFRGLERALFECQACRRYRMGSAS